MEMNLKNELLIISILNFLNKIHIYLGIVIAYLCSFFGFCFAWFIEINEKTFLSIYGTKLIFFFSN